MKKIFLTPLIVLALLACNSDSSKTEAPKVVDITKDPNYQKGLELVSKSGCFTCHAVDTKITGPAYREIADKYAGMPDTIVSHLAGKVITGGSGVWGEIPMIPHPGISKADAETMVRYVLLLRTQH